MHAECGQGEQGLDHAALFTTASLANTCMCVCVCVCRGREGGREGEGGGEGGVEGEGERARTSASAKESAKQKLMHCRIFSSLALFFFLFFKLQGERYHAQRASNAMLTYADVC
jgi:hypothetical protein